jgi:hypothetical protein
MGRVDLKLGIVPQKMNAAIQQHHLCASDMKAESLVVVRAIDGALTRTSQPVRGEPMKRNVVPRIGPSSARRHSAIHIRTCTAIINQ